MIILPRPKKIMKAYSTFLKYCVRRGLCPSHIEVLKMPSTSPANAMKDALATKTKRWRELLGEEFLEELKMSSNIK